MYKIKFYKMHGLGNDFIIVDQNQIPMHANLSSLAVKISDRKTGIGCDQFIIYNKLDSISRDNYKMIIYNKDGSPAEMCGNAARCLASLIKKDTDIDYIIITAGENKIDCLNLESGLVSVNMGKVSFSENWMPKNEQLWEIAGRYSIEPKEMICADIGNPHLVIFNDMSLDDKSIIGAKMQEHEFFPGGINVKFAKIIDEEIKLIVWERGTGLTLSCGSGACATFASAVKLGFIGEKAKISFSLGSLEMTLDKDQNIIMVGPSKLVAEGEFYAS